MPDGSPYLDRPLRTLREVKAGRLVRRAIRLSRDRAERGDDAGARRAWRLAARLSYLCGGISGALWAAGGHSAVVLADGLVAWSPVPLVAGDGR